MKHPVRLWAAREKYHKIQSSFASRGVLAIGVIFIVCLAFFVLFAGDFVANAFIRTDCSFADINGCGGVSPKGPLVLGAVFFITTMIVWLMRVLMRVFLSERHLALDAAERRAFAETYLALLKGDQVMPEHEALILNSLFRPTQDGIIKDDGVSELGLHSFASKMLEGRRKLD